MPTVDPAALAKDTAFINAMTRAVNRVGVVAYLNRADDRRGAFLFAQSIPADVKAAYGENRTGGLTFAAFKDAVEPAICEVLETEPVTKILVKKPEVPKEGTSESGYVVDADDPFMELGRGNAKAEELTNGARVLRKVCEQLAVVADFQRRGNDLIDLFAATLDGLNTVSFGDVGKLFAKFSYGAPLPPRFVEPFVNFLFHRDGGPEAFDSDALWAKPSKAVQEAAAKPTDERWGEVFYDQPKRQRAFVEVVAAFKACLFGNPDTTVELQKKVHEAYTNALGRAGERGRFADLPEKFRGKEPARKVEGAFAAYHYLGRVLRSKILLMSVAEAVVRSYFGEQQPDDAKYQEVFDNLRAGKGVPAPVRRLPEKHRRRLRQAMTKHLEFLLQEVRWKVDNKGKKADKVPTVADTYAGIAGRLKKAGKDLDATEKGKDTLATLLDNLTDDLLGENRQLTPQERAALTKAGVRLIKDELGAIQVLREAGMDLPPADEDKDGLRALLTLRATARMASALEGHLETFGKMFEKGDAAFHGFLRATQNLIRDVVSPIIFAAPGLTPEQLIALFKEAVNATFVNSVLLDDATLRPVLALAEKYKDKIKAQTEDAEVGGQKVFRLRRGAGARTVAEFLPALLSAVVTAAGDKLKTGLEALHLLLDDFVRRVRNSAAARKAGMGSVFMLQKGTLPAGKAEKGAPAEAAKSPGSAENTEGVMQPELETIVEYIVTEKEPAASVLQQRQEKAERITGAVDKVLPKTGAADWGKAIEAADKAAEAGGGTTPADDRYRAAKLAVYRRRAANEYARYEKPGDAAFEQVVDALSKQLLDELTGEWEQACAAVKKKLDEAGEAVDAELEKDPADERKLEAALARKGDAEAEWDLHRTHLGPDKDLIREAVGGLKELAPLRPTPVKEAGFEAFLAADAEAPVGPTAKPSKVSKTERLRRNLEAAAQKANNLEDVFREVYEKYHRHNDKKDFARTVEQMELLKLMLLAEGDLGLGKDMSEYYQLLLDLVLEPDLAEFRGRFPLSKYFDLQTPVHLTQLYNVLSGASRDALRRLQSFVSELLGLEHLFKAAAKNPSAEVVIWNMTAGEFLDGLGLAGDTAGEVAGALLPTGLTDPGFRFPMVLYVTDSAFGYSEGAKADFLRQLAAKPLRFKTRALVPPPVVTSFAGVGRGVRKKPEDPLPPLKFTIPPALAALPADDLPFPFYLLGPSRPCSTQETFLTCVPAGYELLGHLLGDVSEHPITGHQVDLVPVEAAYLHLLRLGGKNLLAGFEELLFPDDGDSLWTDLFLTCLNVIAVHQSRNSLLRARPDFDRPELQKWFDLWIEKGRGTRAEKGKRDQLEAAFWGRVIPKKYGPLKKLLRGLEVIPAGPDKSPGPLMPPAPLEAVTVPPDRSYEPQWFNRLWPKLGVELEAQVEEPE
jgi:hypothetical protein